ncbi:flagellin [Afifella aestuarii]|uniref:flagellin N-terminal helical domain-containing protein n=1 Tax=Afifella aestuarii TaxID=1909496 RepID=UPI000FE35F1B|nr:flagellin [Afifella aestuarii]
MSSLITNTSAMVALQTLRSINSNLDETNNRVSTGLRVNTASDNAAYWSIATTMRSDNQAMSAVKDALGMGSATVDAAYTGLSKAEEVLTKIKASLGAATGEGVDRAKVQEQISAYQDQLKTIAESASFSGQNWLSTGSSTAFNKEIVSSLSRDANNKLAIGTIDVDITNTRLYGDGTAQFGILDKTIDLNTYTSNSGQAASVETAAVAFAAADDKISFSVSQNGAPAKTVEITQQTLADAGLSDTSIRSNADLAAVYTQALKDAGIEGIDVVLDGSDQVEFSSTDDFSISGATTAGATGITVASLGLSATDVTTSAAAAGAASVATIDISSASGTEVQNFMKVVDEALGQVTSAASSLGTVQTRIDMQTEFVKTLMSTIDTGVGALVDADMEEESTKLKALQTQQQLAVQSLSIANSSSQNILSLFR